MSAITGRTFLQPQAALLTAGVITAIPVDTATKFRGDLAVIASVLRQHPEAVPGWSMVSEQCSAPFAVEHATGRQIPLYFGVALGTIHVDHRWASGPRRCLRRGVNGLVVAGSSCETCGSKHADINAAKVIEARGARVLAGDSQPRTLGSHSRKAASTSEKQKRKAA